VTPFLAEKDIPGHSENLRSLASSVEGLDISPAPSAPTASANPPSNQPPPVSNNGATEQKIQSVMSVTGASRQEVVEALRACNGNADAAAQMLSGFGF
jgi:NACalpha-BTF3-like transcription factor